MNPLVRVWRYEHRLATDSSSRRTLRAGGGVGGAALEGTRYYLEKLQVRTPPPHPTARSRVPSGDAPSTSSKTHVPSCSQPPGSQRPETGDSWRVDKLECHHTMN